MDFENIVDFADDQLKPLDVKFDVFKQFPDDQGMYPKKAYTKNDNDEEKYSHLAELLDSRRHGVVVFTKEERELIACAFKN